TGEVAYYAWAGPFKSTSWTYLTSLRVASFEAAANDFLRMAIIAALAGLALTCLAVVLFARKNSRAVGRISVLVAMPPTSTAPSGARRGRLDPEQAIWMTCSTPTNSPLVHFSYGP